MKKIFISSDHAGYNLKEQIIKKFSKKYKFLDLGTNSSKTSVNYPYYAHKLCKKVANNTKYHNAFNGGEENRIHLVACVLDHKFN